MGNHAMDAAVGWRVMAALPEDERLDFVNEPPGIETLLPPLLNHPVLAGKLVTDAYLASFAIAASRRLVTPDRDFRRFDRINLELPAE